MPATTKQKQRESERRQFVHSGKTKGLPGTGAGLTKDIEEDYLRVIRDELTPAVMKEIVQSAIKLAKNGDRHAREWCAQWFRERGVSMLELASDDQKGVTTEKKVRNFRKPTIE